MKLHPLIYGLCVLIALSACEERIEIDVNEPDPRIVIDAQLNNIGGEHHIVVSQSVALTATVNALPIHEAEVSVREPSGREHRFLSRDNGIYVNRSLRLVEGRTYTLSLLLAGKAYQATSTMPKYIAVDSIGVVKEAIFGDDYYFASLKFDDPAEEPNYYKYAISVNGSSYKFAAVYNDKFNDGLFVTHQVGDAKRDLVVGDSIRIQRMCVDKATYVYWSEVLQNNPGAAAPGNPSNNISNGALGIFSVASAREYGLSIRD